MVQIKLPFTFVLAAAAIAPVVALLFVPGARANDIADGSGGNLDGGHRGNPRETFNIIEKARDDSEPPGGKGKGKGKGRGKGKGKGRGKGKGKGQKGGGGSGGGSESDTPPKPLEQLERSFDDLDLEAREYDYLD